MFGWNGMRDLVHGREGDVSCAPWSHGMEHRELHVTEIEWLLFLEELLGIQYT